MTREVKPLDDKDEGGFVYPSKQREFLEYSEELAKKMPTKGEMMDVVYQGITRRDWLAGLAMQAIITNYEGWYEDWPVEKGGPDVASESYRMADLLIAEGKK